MMFIKGDFEELLGSDGNIAYPLYFQYSVAEGKHGGRIRKLLDEKL